MGCSPCCTCLRFHRSFAAILLILLAVAFGGAVHEMSLLGQVEMMDNTSKPITKLELMVRTISRGNQNAVDHYRTLRVSVLITSLVWMIALVADLARCCWEKKCRRIYWIIAAAAITHGLAFIVYAQGAYAYAGSSPGTFVFAGGNMLVCLLYTYSLRRSLRRVKPIMLPVSFSNPVAVSTINTQTSTISDLDITAAEEARSRSSTSSSSTPPVSPPPVQHIMTVAETHHI